MLALKTVLASKTLNLRTQVQRVVLLILKRAKAIIKKRKRAV